MLRKIIFRIIILSWVLIFAQCASAPQKIKAQNITTLLKLTRQKILNSSAYLEQLKTEKVAKDGFYYIVNTDGIIVFHPQPLQAIGIFCLILKQHRYQNYGADAVQ